MSKKFWKIYKIFVVAFLTFTLCLFVTLWLFLSSFEASEPTNLVADVVSFFENNNTKKIKKYLSYKESIFNTEKIIDELINTKLNKKEYHYEKTPKDNDKELKYLIKSGTEKIATVTLTLNQKKGMFNLNRWDISSITDLLGEEKTIDVIAPKNYDIYLNDVLIPTTYLKDENYLTSELTNINKYIKVSPLNKYIIKGLYNEPILKSIVDDKNIEIIQKENTYFVKFKGNNKLQEELKEYIENFCKNYTRYVVNEQGFGTISSYVIPSSKAYTFLRDVAGSNNWMGNHTPTEFTELIFENMQMYNDEAFSIDVKYTYSYKVLGKEKNFDALLTLYMVKQNNKWLIADLNT